MDADHLVAVSTLTAEERRLMPAARLGLFWGLGHMLVLGLIGIPALLLRLDLPRTLETSVDLIVGTLLVFLGVRSLLRLRRERIHFHAHAHFSGDRVHAHFSGDRDHAHFHVHRNAAGHQHSHAGGRTRRAFLTFGMGCVQGLAGSGAAAVLALAASPSTWAGVLYILVFGLGTLLGMFTTTLALAAPALATGRRFAPSKAECGRLRVRPACHSASGCG
jgi:ABC-type nickel/cobalt efflux system permease component RcnA